MTAYRWDSNWKILLLVLIAVPLLMRLGFWQIERAEEKQKLQAQFDQQSSLPPIALAASIQAAADQDLAQGNQRLSFAGHFDNHHMLLLDNRIKNGSVGYEVLAPFTTDQGARLLVNRGWIEGFADRRQLPVIPPVEERVELIAKVYVPLGEPVLLQADQWSEQWPIVVQSVDINRLAERMDISFYPYLLRIEAAESGALLVDWPAVNTRAEKHWGYAVQWFLMAAALLVFLLYSSIKRR
jgi:cytochrome oxidase assembly protein ShyY1